MNIKAHERLAAIKKRKEAKAALKLANQLASPMSSPNSKKSGSPKKNYNGSPKGSPKKKAALTPVSAASTGLASVVGPTNSNFQLASLKTLLTHLGAEIGDEEDYTRAVLARVDLQDKIANANAELSGAPDLNLSRISTFENSILETPIGGAALAPETSDLDASIAKLRENASFITAKLASQARDEVNTNNIWSALQTLELELQKASSATSSPRSPDHQQTSHSPSPGHGHGQALGGKALFSTTPGPASGRSTSGSGKKSISGQRVDGLTVATAAEEQARSVLSSSLRGSTESLSSIRSLNSISPISAAIHSQKTNLSIFKSPAARAKHVHRNIYSEETMSWESDKSLLTNKYNERFQTTHDTIDAKKIFRVLGLAEENGKRLS